MTVGTTTTRAGTIRAHRSSPLHPPALDLKLAFAVGYASSIVPSITRLLAGALSAKRWLHDAAWSLVFYALALGVMSVVYRFAFRRGASLKAASAIAVLAAVPTITLSYVVDYVLALWDPSLDMMSANEPHTLAYVMLTALSDSLVICVYLAAIVFLPVFARAHDERDRELRSVEREAELLRIRTHLEPHFMMNSLNAVAGFVEEDPTQARELLAALGDLFREVADFRSAHRVGDEIDWLKRYVTIHELRHPDVLRASWDVSDDCLDMECPALILQPIVENAVKHGALRGGGHLTIRAHRDGEQFVLTVEDDGPELGAHRHGGRGLSIVRRRLELENLDPGAFVLVREGALTVARVRLPARRGAAHA